jgi:hypothetical protein
MVIDEDPPTARTRAMKCNQKQASHFGNGALEETVVVIFGNRVAESEIDPVLAAGAIVRGDCGSPQFYPAGVKNPPVFRKFAAGEPPGVHAILGRIDSQHLAPKIRYSTGGDPTGAGA